MRAQRSRVGRNISITFLQRFHGMVEMASGPYSAGSEISSFTAKPPPVVPLQ